MNSTFIYKYICIYIYLKSRSFIPYIAASDVNLYNRFSLADRSAGVPINQSHILGPIPTTNWCKIKKVSPKKKVLPQ